MHREFFQQIDPEVFAECREPEFQSAQRSWNFVESGTNVVRTGATRRFRPLTVVSQN